MFINLFQLRTRCVARCAMPWPNEPPLFFASQFTCTEQEGNYNNNNRTNRYSLPAYAKCMGICRQEQNVPLLLWVRIAPARTLALYLGQILKRVLILYEERRLTKKEELVVSTESYPSLWDIRFMHIRRKGVCVQRWYLSTYSPCSLLFSCCVALLHDRLCKAVGPCTLNSGRLCLESSQKHTCYMNKTKPLLTIIVPG